jgi:hypothetical protein
MGDSELRHPLSLGFAAARSQATALQSAVWSDGHELALFGSLAVWVVCSANIRAWLEKNRPEPRDLDFIAFSSSRAVIVASLHELGYREDRELAVMTEGYLYRFAAPGKLTAEVRFDEMRFAHTVSVRGRVRARQATLALDDLLLSKLLIVDMKPPDLFDLIALFAVLIECDIEDPSASALTRQRLFAILGRDWGAWHTTNLSLNKLAGAFNSASELPQPHTLGEMQAAVIEMQNALAACPKSLIWRLRSLIGGHFRWYSETAEPF